MGDISEEDARAEGGYTVEEFKEVWKRIHGSWNPNEEVWVVEFERITERCSAFAFSGDAEVPSALK